MKKILVIFLVMVMFVSIGKVPVNAEDTQGGGGLGISAESAVLICADNGQVIFGKNENEKRAIASTTKIMTSLLALESCEAEDKKVTITNKMVPVEGSSMYLEVGQILTMSGLAKGMLTVSGNDAANSVAIALAGSIEKFAEMMNNKAAQIGMKNTHFVTPSGLDAEEHYSTAYDMALLGAYAMENKMFRDISSKKRVDVQFFEPDKIKTYYNENRLLKRYDGCIGIKTGFTKKAGRCLVSSAERNKTRLVVVTLNAPDDWNDHEKLFDYGFSQVETVTFDDSDDIIVPVVGANNDNTCVCVKGQTTATVPKCKKSKIKKEIDIAPFLYAPLKEGQVAGKVLYMLDGKLIASNELVVKSDVDYYEKNVGIWSKFLNFIKGIFT